MEFVLFGQMVSSDVGISRNHLQGRMSKKSLQHQFIPAVSQELSCEGMPKGVWAYPASQASLDGDTPADVIHVGRIQRSSMTREINEVIADGCWPVMKDVSCQAFGTPMTKEDMSFGTTLANYEGSVVPQVQAGHCKIQGFR